MGINIDAYGELLPYLNVELSDTIGTEDLEATLLGILFESFDDIGCYLPLTAGALRYAAAFSTSNGS